MKKKVIKIILGIILILAVIGIIYASTTLNKKNTIPKFNLEKDLNSILMLFSLFSYFKNENQLITAFNTLNSKKFVYFNKTFFFILFHLKSYTIIIP